jgi:hypothetical protein
VTGDAPPRFEDRLLAELMPLVGAVPAAAAVTGPRVPGRPQPAARRRIAVLLGALLLVLAGVGAGAVLWPRRLATPAYAVQEQPDGSVVVTVNDLSDPIGLQNALAAHHVPAAVLVLDPARPCLAPMSAVEAPGAIQGRPDHPNVLTIRPDRLPPGGVAVLGLFGGPGTAGSGTAGSGTEGSGTAGSGTAGSGTAGPGRTGAAGGAGPLAALFMVVLGPAPRCFPGAVPVQVPTS